MTEQYFGIDTTDGALISALRNISLRLSHYMHNGQTYPEASALRSDLQKLSQQAAEEKTGTWKELIDSSAKLQDIWDLLGEKYSFAAPRLVRTVVAVAAPAQSTINPRHNDFQPAEANTGRPPVVDHRRGFEPNSTRKQERTQSRSFSARPRK